MAKTLSLQSTFVLACCENLYVSRRGYLVVLQLSKTAIGNSSTADRPAYEEIGTRLNSQNRNILYFIEGVGWVFNINRRNFGSNYFWGRQIDGDAVCFEDNVVHHDLMSAKLCTYVQIVCQIDIV